MSNFQHAQKLKSMSRYAVLVMAATLLSIASCGRIPHATTVTLSFEASAPALNEANRLRVVDFHKAMASVHSSCGLDSAKFQRSIQEIQTICSGTELGELSSTYVKAARMCHDVKVKPTKYVSTTSTLDEQVKEFNAAPEVKVLGGGAQVHVVVPVGWKKEHKTAMEATEIIEYSPQLLVSPQSLRKLQRLEDIAFEATVNTLRKAGFDLFDRLDFVATWVWTWADEGRIEFTLKENMTMEAKLFPSGNDLKYKVLDWGDGDWELNNGRLQITMRRVGKVGVPLLTKEHKVKWIDKEVAFVSSDCNEIILAGDEKLRRVKVE